MKDPASESYYEALGRFIEGYAEVEFAMGGLLWSLAKVSTPIARAIFSGTRSEEASKLINRICDIRRTPKEMREEFNFACAQLGQIREARNLVIHYETRRRRDGTPYLVTNRRIALNRKRLHERPISTAILRQMTDDLEKIVGHLIVLLYRSEKMPHREITHVKGAYAKELVAPWQYKPSPNQQQKSRRRMRKDQSKAPTPSGPR
jgi:hypothetical protein